MNDLGKDMFHESEYPVPLLSLCIVPISSSEASFRTVHIISYHKRRRRNTRCEKTGLGKMCSLRVTFHDSCHPSTLLSCKQLFLAFLASLHREIEPECSRGSPAHPGRFPNNPYRRWPSLLAPSQSRRIDIHRCYLIFYLYFRLYGITLG